MAVHIRLARHGRTHQPYYRVVAIDQREHREGKACEALGIYDPFLREKNVQVDIERIHAWIRQGATYTDNLAALLKFGGYELYPAEILEARATRKAKAKAKRKARKKKDGTAWRKPTRRALHRHATKLKHQAKAEAAAKAAAPAESAAETGPADETGES